ncbi:protein disulfide-isomerase precursor [Penicillium angulare]|uniref:protein disulfide-isomerase precursor n=1 Tax=Penicillium angulare TaxID=116970 RepID=UPI002540A1D1|nr:protein disulfide-isomerase precursor [Penicillium angulare]KAJ5263211.1 protein disulfide-isomerase precursor [Penicillium angulare]
MRSSIPYVLSLLGAASAASSAYADTTNSNVVSLTENTFHEYVESHELVMAYFYSPHCGHCKKFAPNYEEAAKILENENVSLVKIDCTTEMDICYKEYYITAWPTLMLLSGPEPTEKILGYRKTDSVVSIVMDVLGSDGGETESYGQLHGQTPLRAEGTE